jgi:hypothetical protein
VTAREPELALHHPGRGKRPRCLDQDEEGRVEEPVLDPLREVGPRRERERVEEDEEASLGQHPEDGVRELHPVRVAVRDEDRAICADDSRAHEHVEGRAVGIAAPPDDLAIAQPGRGDLVRVFPAGHDGDRLRVGAVVQPLGNGSLLGRVRRGGSPDPDEHVQRLVLVLREARVFEPAPALHLRLGHLRAERPRERPEGVEERIGGRCGRSRAGTDENPDGLVGRDVPEAPALPLLPGLHQQVAAGAAGRRRPDRHLRRPRRR